MTCSQDIPIDAAANGTVSARSPRAGDRTSPCDAGAATHRPGTISATGLRRISLDLHPLSAAALRVVGCRPHRLVCGERDALGPPTGWFSARPTCRLRRRLGATRRGGELRRVVVEESDGPVCDTASKRCMSHECRLRESSRRTRTSQCWSLAAEGHRVCRHPHKARIVGLK